jgi:hypothetical protein
MPSYVLEILDGDRAGEVVPVSDRALRIGRKPGNDLVLADEKTSGVHAEVVLEGDRHVLRDLGSTNGTFLDGKRVTELVLTPGDVVTVGRLRVKFRTEGDAAATGDAGELAVRRLDATRGRGRGGSIGALAAVLVLALGAGGWFWWQNRQAGASEAGAPTKQRAALDVAGNKLAAATAQCESDAGWTLRAGGVGFVGTSAAHTGQGAFEARRGEGDNADFAVLRTAEPTPVFQGRTMTLAAHVRTSGGGRVALRALASAANEQVPFTFRTGTTLAAHADWTRLEVVLAVPSGCDRLQLEVAAVLPGADALVQVDDVALTEAGNVPPVEQKFAEGSPTAIGAGAALALRAVGAEPTAIVLAVLPAEVPAELQAMHRADLCVLSDLGASLAVTPGERGFTCAAQGVESLQLVLPDAAAGGLLVATGGSFLPVPADSEFTAQTLLVGEGVARAMLQFDGEKACRGRSGGGRYRLTVPTNRVELVLAFASERQQANTLLRQARGARDEGRPGEALDKLRELATKVPMDTEVLGQAGVLRGELLAAQAKQLARLQTDLDEATFFTTRGGFERVVLGVDELVQLYGKDNLEDEKGAMALREAASAKLAAIAAMTKDEQRTRLGSLAKAFADADQPALAKLVQDYIAQHLN